MCTIILFVEVRKERLMPRKKGNSQGTIYYRKDRNKWIAQYYDYDPITLKRIKKEKSFNAEEKAKQYLQSIMFQKENPIYIENNGIPLKELMKAVLQNKYDTNVISESQYDRIQKTLKSIFKSELVNKKVDEILPEEIQKYINTYRNYSNSTIKKVMEQFNQAFKYAFDRGYIIRNPMTQVIKPKSLKPNKIVRAMTLDEENKFINYIKDKSLKECPYKNEYLIQLFMGLRIGECLALTKDDIDLKNMKIHVHKTLTHDIKGNVLLKNSPKTQAGNRYVPIPDSLYPYLIEQIEYSETQKNNEEKLLFKPPQNKYTDSKNVNRALLKILKNLNIEHMSSHSLRHTYATRAIEAKITPVVLQTLMGHTDISTTIDIYTDVFDEFKDNELEKVNEYYTKNNLLQEKKSNDITKDNIIKLSEFKSNIINNKTDEDKLNESLENYER